MTPSFIKKKKIQWYYIYTFNPLSYIKTSFFVFQSKSHHTHIQYRQQIYNNKNLKDIPEFQRMVIWLH